MLKGYTKIELTDVHTGEKDVVEKHNLITNNLKNILEWLHAWGFTTSQYSKLQTMLFPVYDNCMGGIILFSNTLDENVDNVLLPMTSEDDVTGYASNNVNTTENKKRGSRNITESTKLDNGYKMVWDFGTSQANGTISALSLTNAYACARPGILTDICNNCGNAIKKLPNNVTPRKVVDYNVYTDKVTYLDLSSPTTLILHTATFNSNVASIEGFNIYKELTSKQVNLSEELPLGGWWIDGKDGYYYYHTIWENNNNVSDDSSAYYSTIKVARVKKETLELDASIGLKTIKLSYAKWSCPDCMLCVCNGYIYFGGSNSRNGGNAYIEKIDLASSQVIKTFYVENRNGIVYAINDIVYAGSKCILSNDEMIQKSEYDQYGYIFSQSSNKESGLWENASGSYTGKVLTNDKGQIVAVEQNIIYYGFLLNNLCTINNLETPVTKTADKTMKITYTITEE